MFTYATNVFKYLLGISKTQFSPYLATFHTYNNFISNFARVIRPVIVSKWYLERKCDRDYDIFVSFFIIVPLATENLEGRRNGDLILENMFVFYYTFIIRVSPTRRATPPPVYRKLLITHKHSCKSTPPSPPPSLDSYILAMFELH